MPRALQQLQPRHCRPWKPTLQQQRLPWTPRGQPQQRWRHGDGDSSRSRQRRHGRRWQRHGNGRRRGRRRCSNDWRRRRLLHGMLMMTTTSHQCACTLVCSSHHHAFQGSASERPHHAAHRCPGQPPRRADAAMHAAHLRRRVRPAGWRVGGRGLGVLCGGGAAAGPGGGWGARCGGRGAGAGAAREGGRPARSACSPLSHAGACCGWTSTESTIM